MYVFTTFKAISLAPFVLVVRLIIRPPANSASPPEFIANNMFVFDASPPDPPFPPIAKTLFADAEVPLLPKSPIEYSLYFSALPAALSLINS